MSGKHCDGSSTRGNATLIPRAKSLSPGRTQQLTKQWRTTASTCLLSSLLLQNQPVSHTYDRSAAHRVVTFHISCAATVMGDSWAKGTQCTAKGTPMSMSFVKSAPVHSYKCADNVRRDAAHVLALGSVSATGCQLRNRSTT